MLLPFLAGCAGLNTSGYASEGPGAALDPAALASYRAAQDKALVDLALMANVGSGSVKETVEADGRRSVTIQATSWDAIVKAGMEYSDHRCDRYLDALFKLNRGRKATVAQIGLLGSAAAGLMAAAKSAARDVAMVAIAFGLASSSVDTLAGSLLYELEPSSVQAIVRTLQDQYRANLGTGYNDRSAAVLAMRRYALLCVPETIEAEVNLAVKKAIPGVSPAQPALGKPPTVSNGPIVMATWGPDVNSALLRLFVFPNGKLDDENRRKVEAFLQSERLGISVVMLINGAEYAAERARAVKQLQLNEAPK
jgi:hypothetical protein